MNSGRITQAFLLWVCLIASVAARAEDWPQWLGPQRDSVWGESGVVRSFGPGGPPVVWRAAIGAGYSGPIVAEGRVYLTDRLARPEAKPGADASQVAGPVERVLCFSESNGSLLWKHEYSCKYTISYNAGPRVAPLVSGGQVYTLGAEGTLCCLDAVSGELVWSRELKKDYQIRAPGWGFAGHPLLDGERLICLAGGAGTTALAFDRKTGKELWRALTADEPGYSSPVLVQAGGKRQLILFHGEAANSLDPATGDVYWSVPFKCNMGLGVATPRLCGDSLFFTSFYNGAMMLALGSNTPTASLRWKTTGGNERDTTHLNAIIGTPLYEDGYIYGVCSYGQLRCLKADTGERVWETLKATTSGEPVRWANAFIVKNGDRFFLLNEKGDLIIARLSPQGYEEISRANLLEPTNKDCGRLVVWSHPAFANRRCYARNDKELVCVDLAQKK